MSKQHRSIRGGNPPPAAKRGFHGATVIVLVLAVAVVLGFWWHRSRVGETPPTAAGDAGPAFQELPGRWIRPDGGYVVEIKRVADDGKMEAAYFNPNPIHVSRAEASRDGATTNVFIELNDVNYPGSTYTLTYEPESDQLRGIYYQAALRQSYEVIFLRMK